jgi:hypothetical protein
MIYSNYYEQNKPKSGVVDLIRLGVEPREKFDQNYWRNYNMRIEKLRSWSDRQKRHIDAIKEFARSRFPRIQFRQAVIPIQPPAPNYPELPWEAPPDYAPSPPETAKRIRSERD